MQRVIFGFAALCLLFSNLLTAQQVAEGPFEQLIIRGVTLINGDGAPPRGPIDIVVEGNTITKIRAISPPPH